MSFSTTTTATTTTTIHNNNNDPCHPSKWAPSEWVATETQLIPGDDDEEMLSAASFQAANKVLEQWLSDGQHHEPHQRAADNIDVIPCDSSASSLEQELELDCDRDCDHELDEDLTSLMEVDEQIGENLLGDEVFGGPCGMSEGDHLQLHLQLGGSSSSLSMSMSMSMSMPAIDTDTDTMVSFEEYPTLMNSFSALHMVDDNMSEEDRRFLAPLLEDSSTTAMDYDAGYVVTDDDESSFSSSSLSPSNTNSDSSSPSPVTDHERYQEIMKKLEASMKRSQETRKSLTMKTPETKKYKRRRKVTGVLSSIETSSRQLQTFWQSVQQRNPV
eukprot:jgi/Psemu1/44546/gm1.44546_g